MMAFWQRLTEPPKTIQDPEQRRKTRLLMVLLLFCIPLGLATSVTIVLAPVTTYPWPSLIILSTVLLVIAFAINRAGHYKNAALLLIGTSTLVFFGIALPDGARPGNALLLIYLIVPVLISSTLLPGRPTVVLVVLIVIGLGIYSMVYADAATRVITTFWVVVSGLALVIERGRSATEASRRMDVAERERQYRGQFEAIADAIHINADGVIIDVNPAFEQMFGYSRDEIIGRLVLDFIPEDMHRLVLQSRHTRSEVPYESEGKHKDGTIFPLEIVPRNYTQDGRQLRVVTMRDITRRKQSESEKLQLAIERERVEVLRIFLTDVSHDLRTPLTILKNNVYLIEKTADDSSAWVKRLGIIDAQIDHMEKLIENLLTMSRLDAAPTTFNFESQDLNLVINDVFDEQESLAMAKGQVLQLSLDTNLEPVLIDTVEFKRVIRHLIVNAVSYTPEGGTITIQTGQVDDDTVVKVSDTGTGISPEEIPHIFERFYRADKARQIDTGGMGLGLAITRQIVHAHGGTITVESSPGAGTIFTIRLPSATHTAPTVSRRPSAVTSEDEDSTEPEASAPPEPTHPIVPDDDKRTTSEAEHSG